MQKPCASKKERTARRNLNRVTHNASTMKEKRRAEEPKN